MPNAAPTKFAPTGDVGSRTTSKLRRRLIPLLFLLYVVAYLDRINIGFVSLTMNATLAITNAQFGLLIGIFFWGYFIFEVPSNILLHRIGARIWIARILVTWGIVAMLTGAVRSVPQLYVARFLLGVAEAGFCAGGVHEQEVIGGHAARIPGCRDRTSLQPPPESVADVAIEFPIHVRTIFTPVLRVVVQVEAD
jgi:hypothetical protein